MLPNAHPLPNGLVVMFEGIDGVGKTTQIGLAEKALEKAGWPVVTARNMGGTPIGEALREVVLSPLERPPLTDFYASLAIQEPLFGMIESARKAGSIILLDRGPLSLAAYQIFGAGINEPLGWQHVTAGMERFAPEAVILYDTEDIQLVLQRKDSAKPDYFESKSPDYFQKVAEGYRIAARRFPMVTTIDAIQPIETVQDETLAVISKLLQPQP